MPLNEDGADRSAATLIPLIKKFIRPNSVIISDGWKAYNSIGSEGYEHKVVNHSENFVDPHDPETHTQTVERLWRDIKEWTRRPGMKSVYFEQYFGRYLFLKAHPEDAVHQFFLEAGKLYPPMGNRARPGPQHGQPASDDEEDQF